MKIIERKLLVILLKLLPKPVDYKIQNVNEEITKQRLVITHSCSKQW